MLEVFALFGVVCGWRFATYDDIFIKCALCKRIVNKTRAGMKEILPVNGSFCDEHPEDRICAFISDTVLGVGQVRDLDGYCQKIWACPPSVPDGYTGFRCEICVTMISHLLLHKSEDRAAAFDYFCMTSRIHPLSFCGDIVDEGIDGFLSDLSSIEVPVELCDAYHYCRFVSEDL
jgi:hypothetical protein